MVAQSTLALLGVLDQLSTLIDETPCTTQSQRFGNTAFREWHAKVAKASGEMIQTVLPEGKGAAAVELDGYFLDAFGNPTRIDYGSGACCGPPTLRDRVGKPASCRCVRFC